MSILQRIRHWYSLQGTVSRQEYLLTGFCLTLLKYGVEAGTIGYTTGKFYSLWDFFNPLLSARSQFTIGAPDWLGLAWVLWTIPFVWIAVTMSVRRSIDAGFTGWTGLLVLFPVLNIAAMLYLAWVPHGYSNRRPGQDDAPQRQKDFGTKQTLDSAEVLPAILSGLGIGFVYTFGLALFFTTVMESYGAGLFFGTPIVAGAATGYVYNRSSSRSRSSTIGVSLLTAMCFAGALLLFGVEGLICIAMSAPLMVPLGALGALAGRAIAVQCRTTTKKKDTGLVGCLLMVPLFSSVEPYVAPNVEFEVSTSVEIQASPERVWQCVISFPEITEPPQWYFRWGISCPQGARIDGTGVGAVRHCDFTTGSFVEPITTWQEPLLLAFDVTMQPEPMTELSPYRHIHPPHLDGSFRSTHGEFRLIPLADGGTRLEGRTWYKLDIYPHAYWTLWTDWLLHRIHDRVLRHIKRLAEDEKWVATSL